MFTIIILILCIVILVQLHNIRHDISEIDTLTYKDMKRYADQVIGKQKK